MSPKRSRLLLTALCAIGLACTVGTAPAQVLYATGANNGDPTHSTGNYIYAIDPWTGKATPVSPVINTSPPAGLAGARDGRLLGFRNGQLVQVDPSSGTWINLGAPSGVTATGFDILADGRGFLTPFNAGNQTQQLHQIDLESGAVSPIGTENAIGAAIEAAAGWAAGTARPFIISLGSVRNRLYGVDLSTDSLIALNPDTGDARVIGAIGAVDLNEGGRFSGYSALTGVDLNNDGSFDALYGTVNFYDPDGRGPQPSQRFGGIARYNLRTGTWSLVGNNPGLIFFGLGSSPSAVPEPGVTALLLGIGVFGVKALRRVRR